jgi:hypothetical protein
VIHLIRVYRDDQIQPVHVEAFDKGEPLPNRRYAKNCRCIPTATDYYNELAVKYDLGRKLGGTYFQRYEFGRIDMEWIYPTPTKKRPNDLPA